MTDFEPNNRTMTLVDKWSVVEPDDEPEDQFVPDDEPPC
jgi:hypothetical protein